MAADPRTRQIKIKTGVVRRLAREEACYVADVRKQEERIERMKAAAAAASGRADNDDDDAERAASDECDIRKQEEVLQECHMMIPDCRRRLAAARDDLLAALERAAGEDPDLVSTSQEFQDARSLLDSVKMEEMEEEVLMDCVRVEEGAESLVDYVKTEQEGRSLVDYVTMEEESRSLMDFVEMEEDSGSLVDCAKMEEEAVGAPCMTDQDSMDQWFSTSGPGTTSGT